jgi:DivIVA domain-containing protein
MAELTPSDVHNVAFRKSPLGKRGYDEEDVDAFLDRVERTLAQMGAEIASLHAQTGGAASSFPAQRMGDTEAGQGAVLAELDQIKLRLARIEAALTGGRNQSIRTDPALGGLP